MSIRRSIEKALRPKNIYKAAKTGTRGFVYFLFSPFIVFYYVLLFFFEFFRAISVGIYHIIKGIVQLFSRITKPEITNSSTKIPMDTIMPDSDQELQNDSYTQSIESDYDYYSGDDVFTDTPRESKKSSLTLVKLQCPNCGANLELDSDKKQCFCTYCGTKILLHNENEYIVHHIDDTRLREAELQYSLKMKQMQEEKAEKQKELAIEKERTDRLKKRKKNAYIASTIVALTVIVAGLICLSASIGASVSIFLCGGMLTAGLLWYAIVKIPQQEQDKVLLEMGGIRFPKNLSPFEEKNYITILSSLESAGFTNITCRSLRDIKLGVLQKPGKVERVSVNGETISSGGRVYLPDALIIITYHGR